MSEMEIREYQEEALRQLYDVFFKHEKDKSIILPNARNTSALLILPTGAGKSVVIKRFYEEYLAEKGYKLVICIPRKEIGRQFELHFDSHDVRFLPPEKIPSLPKSKKGEGLDVEKAKQQRNKTTKEGEFDEKTIDPKILKKYKELISENDIMVVNPQTLAKRPEFIELLKKQRLFVFFDEAHHLNLDKKAIDDLFYKKIKDNINQVASGNYASCFYSFFKKPIISTTATPIRHEKTLKIQSIDDLIERIKSRNDDSSNDDNDDNNDSNSKTIKDDINKNLERLPDFFNHHIQTTCTADLVRDGVLSRLEILNPAFITKQEMEEMLDKVGIDKKKDEYKYDKIKEGESLKGDEFIGKCLDFFISKYDPSTMTKGVVFAIDTKHAKRIKEALTQRGFKAELFVGEVEGENKDESIKMSDSERDRIFNGFKSGDTQILSTVNIFVEGVDVKNIDFILYFRPLRSLVWWLQTVGRGLRSFNYPDGRVKYTTMFDFVFNADRLGDPSKRGRVNTNNIKIEYHDEIADKFEKCIAKAKDEAGRLESFWEDNQGKAVMVTTINREIELAWVILRACRKFYELYEDEASDFIQEKVEIISAYCRQIKELIDEFENWIIIIENRPKKERDSTFIIPKKQRNQNVIENDAVDFGIYYVGLIDEYIRDYRDDYSKDQLTETFIKAITDLNWDIHDSDFMAVMKYVLPKIQKLIEKDLIEDHVLNIEENGNYEIVNIFLNRFNKNYPHDT